MIKKQHNNVAWKKKVRFNEIRMGNNERQHKVGKELKIELRR